MKTRDLILTDTGVAAPAGGAATRMALDQVANLGLRQVLARHALRYRDVCIRTTDLDLMRKPLNKAVLLWLLARRRAVIQDQLGASIAVDAGLLLCWWWRKLRGAWAKGGAVARCLQELEQLEAVPLQPASSLGDGPPVYLRTDLVFGLKSGGSVGHIAGVLNQLHHIFPGTRFFSTDSIPTVAPEVPLELFRPSSLLADFPECRQLVSGWDFADWALARLDGHRPRFIYHRFGINNLSGVLMARRLGVPLVLEFNGSEVWANRHWGRVMRDEQTALRMEAACLRHADLIVVVSDPLREQLLEMGIPEERILAQPNGVDPQCFHPDIDGSQVRARHGLSQRRVVGFIGTFGRWHGADVLVQAFARLLERRPELREQVALMMIGDGETMPQVKQLISALGLEQQVRLTGLVPQPEGPAHLAACDILVAPHVPNADGSRFFGSPTKLFEYMAMGKGIVASELDQIGDILDHNRTAWMIPPGDVDALAAGIETLLDDPELAARLGAKARERALRRHTWEQYTRRIINLVDARYGGSVDGAVNIPQARGRSGSA